MSHNGSEDAASRLRGLLEADAYLTHSQATAALDAARTTLPTSRKQWLLGLLNPPKAWQDFKLHRLVKGFDKQRDRHNAQAVKRELKRHKRLFDDISGYPLDDQQRRAVVADEDNSLVIAGAGSGKTLTIVGKVRYLVDGLGVAPRTILPISFTNKSAASLKERIGIDGVNPQTFHAFGLRVLRTVERRQPQLFDDSELDKLLRDFIGQLLKKPDGAYRRELATFCKQYDMRPEDFTSLSRTFLALLKSDGKTVKEVRLANRDSDASDFLKRRADQFLRLFAPLLALYQRYLQTHGLIDFHDMVNRASHYIERGDYRHGLRYVIVDEFQDLSFGRYRILQAIRAQTPDVKFYCVGDDWQSIYRFAGSDMALFRDFADYFGHTATSRIETTYRFNQPMIGLSSDFILRNPNQTVKQLRAPKGRPATTFQIMETGSREDDTDGVLQALTQLASDHGLSPDNEIYVVGRYNFDLKRLHDVPGKLKVDAGRGEVIYRFPDGPHQGKQLTLQFITAHRAKGLEADFAILINCNRGKFGFPSEQADDPILSLLLSSADRFEHGEERRLFYVAMTRAKLHTIFVCDPARPSPFITELKQSFTTQK